MPSHTRALRDALADSEPLARLTERLRQSRARFALLQPLLPLPMRPAVQAGPIDDEAYTLLVSGNAVAAKLRQMAPQLQAALDAAGLGHPPRRVKLHVPATPAPLPGRPGPR